MDRVQTLARHLTGAAPSPASSSRPPAPSPAPAPIPTPARATTKHRRYTRDGGPLTEAQRDFYEENGYLVVDDLYSEEQIDAYRRRFVDLCRKPELRATTLKVMRDIALVKKGIPADDERAITKIWDYFDDAPLFEYCQNAKTHEVLRSFVGENQVSSHLMVIHKPRDPGEGTSRHPLHQDHLYFPWSIEDVGPDGRPLPTTVASWTAMQDITRENGCLVVVPGSHRSELIPHVYPDWVANNHSYIGLDGITSAVKLVHLPMKKGQTVFFHSLLWHGSGRNLTDGGRLAISCHWVSADTHFINVARTIQEPLEAEQRDMARLIIAKIAGVPSSEVTEDMMEGLTMAQMWEPRMRIVRGDKFLEDRSKEGAKA